MEIIPAVDLMKGKVVRLLRGNPKTVKSYDHLGDPVGIARKWEEQGASSLHIIDLDAALGMGENMDTINEIAHGVKVPLQVGGGIRSLERAKSLLEHGIGRIILGSLAFSEPQAVKELEEKFGQDRLIVALDHQDGTVVVNGWKASTGLNIDEALAGFLDLRIKAFLVTSTAVDGTLAGPDFKTLGRACTCCRARVIAAGGISSLNDLIVLKRIGVVGAVVGKALYEGRFTLKQALDVVGGDGDAAG